MQDDKCAKLFLKRGKPGKGTGGGVGQALARLTPEQRKGVPGANKAKAFEAGKLRQGMIKPSWRSVQKRIAQTPDKGARLKPDMGSAYEIAKTGGKHSGWYKSYREQGERQLLKGIRKLEKQIFSHENWIANLLSKIQS